MDQVLLGQYEAALPFLDQAYQIDPTYAEIHYWKFKAYQRLEPQPEGLDSPGPLNAQQVIEYTDMVSWREEAEEYLATLPSAGKSGNVTVEMALIEGAKEPPPPPPPPPGSTPQPIQQPRMP